jgi:hypothetical protein
LGLMRSIGSSRGERSVIGRHDEVRARSRRSLRTADEIKPQRPLGPFTGGRTAPMPLIPPASSPPSRPFAPMRCEAARRQIGADPRTAVILSCVQRPRGDRLQDNGQRLTVRARHAQNPIHSGCRSSDPELPQCRVSAAPLYKPPLDPRAACGPWETASPSEPFTSVQHPVRRRGYDSRCESEAQMGPQFGLDAVSCITSAIDETL